MSLPMPPEMTYARAVRLVRAILACLVLALLTAAPAAAAPGDLDAGFGTGGSVFTAPGTSNTIYGVRVQSDGKIVAAGQSNSGVTSRIGVARYNADGSLDSGFGSSGTVVTTSAPAQPPPTSSCRPTARSLLPAWRRSAAQTSSRWSDTTRTARSTPASARAE